MKLTDDLKVRSIIIPDKIILTWTLNHLTSDYEYTMTIINQTFRLNLDDIKIKSLFSQLLDESRRLRSKDVKKTVFSTKINTVKDDNNKFKCHYCYKQGHNEAKCWKKHSEKKSKKTGFRDTKSKQQNTEDNEKVILIVVHESLLYNEKERGST